MSLTDQLRTRIQHLLNGPRPEDTPTGKHSRVDRSADDSLTSAHFRDLSNETDEDNG